MDDRKASRTCLCGQLIGQTDATSCPKCGKPISRTRATRPAAPPAPPKEPPLPAPIKGYSFVRRLGAGGMGAVFLARQESLDRNVAIKLLPPDFAKDKAYVEGFLREARSAGKLSHENIMGAVDVGESGGRYYFVMEYVEGETLFRHIKRDKAIPEERALGIARQVARGLRHAHQHGLIHRDIKPKNILITSEGVAKICDFGLATEVKAVDAQAGEEEENLHTTPAYASPEQCRADVMDHRTDIYSLGVSLFEALTGRRPFTAATSRELMTQQVTAIPPDPRDFNPDVSEAAAQLVLHMLRKKKEERPANYDELIAEFDAILKPPAEAAEGGSRKKMLILGGAAAAVVLVLAAFALRRGTPPPAPVPQPGPAPVAVLDPEVRKLLEEAQALSRSAAGKPEEYDAVRARWTELEEKYTGTPHQSIFATGRLDFEKGVNAEAGVAAEGLIQEADRAVKEGRPAEALAALRKFPADLSQTQAGNKVAARILEIQEIAGQRFRDGLQSATALLAREKYDEARKAAMALRDAFGAVRPSFRDEADDLLRRISETESRAAQQKPVPVVQAPALPVPGPAPVKATPAAAGPALPSGAAGPYAALRDPAARRLPEARAAAARYFDGLAPKSAFYRAAEAFLTRDESAWRLEGAAGTGLAEYLAAPLLNAADGLRVEEHQRLLELLVQKIGAAGAAPVDALQLFACAHLQELAAKKEKIDPVLLLQAKLGKGNLSDLWGPSGMVARIETASILLKPPGLWLGRAGDAASTSSDFSTRFLGALCTIKDDSFDAGDAAERWKKLGVDAPDPAWTKFCDAIADRIKAETICDLCLGAGKYACSSCAGTGATVCAACRGVGKTTDPLGGPLTCPACRGRKAILCVACNGAKGMKCSGCDGKKTRSTLSGGPFRFLVELAQCGRCAGTGNLFTASAYPCPRCDGNGRVLGSVPAEFGRLPAWALKGREGRALFYALRWLARHQSPDGSWSADAWHKNCPEPGCKSAKAEDFDVGVTSLAVLAFAQAGIGPESDVIFGGLSGGDRVRKALAWLRSKQNVEGLIQHGSTPKPVFENILAVNALFAACQDAPPSEAFGDKEKAKLYEAAQKALRWTLNTQSKGGGWGYTPGATSDTWVSSWGAMALVSGREAGVDIPRINITYLIQWYDGVTDRKDYHLGYTPQQMGRLAAPANFAHHETLSAFGSLMRFHLEGRGSATYAGADKLLEKDLPNAEPQRRDFAYWHFGTLYMAHHEQRRGPGWTAWSHALVRELIALQDSGDRCGLGAWLPNDRWGALGGQVYAVSMNALSLAQVLGARPAVSVRK